METTQSVPTSNSSGFTKEQKEFFEGFFAGVKIRGVSFSDVEKSPEPESVTKEERIKRELHPLDAYPLLLEDSRHNASPEAENVFRYKWNGLFYTAPVHQSYMARLRIPGGQLKSYQLREIARISKELTSGYIQITTRSNFQLRMIEPKNTIDFLRRVQSIGLHTRGSGADNIRNITANPTAGFDPFELIDVTPFVHELAEIIISSREFYDLPRKFNIAFDGGGLIGSVEDTNDIGLKAVKVDVETGGIKPGVYFRVKLGGATGHKAFAKDLGVMVPVEKVVKVTTALVRVFIESGNRADRKKARLKHLLESWSLDKYLDETEKKLGFSLPKLAIDQVPDVSHEFDHPHSHVGFYPQKQSGFNYVGMSIPVGQISPEQLIQVADFSERFGSGDIRLTVWQNLIVPNIPASRIDEAKKSIKRIGFDWEQSHVKSGFIACTGSRYCKYASSDTKGNALLFMEYLDRKIKLDQPVNIHVTGCPHSCAQHYMGDIGLLATKVKVAGESVEGYHLFVGGGFGKYQAVGRQVFTGLTIEQTRDALETMLKVYLDKRVGNESFQQFSSRHDLNQLQVLFSGEK